MINLATGKKNDFIGGKDAFESCHRIGEENEAKKMKKKLGKVNEKPELVRIWLAISEPDLMTKSTPTGGWSHPAETSEVSREASKRDPAPVICLAARLMK